MGGELKEVHHSLCECFPRVLSLRQFQEQVGNLSFYTTEEQIYELFSKCAIPEEGGGLRRIIMGLDSQQK